MSQIKECIVAVAEIIKDNLGTPVTAECIRRSKFDRRESDSVMFDVLYEFICLHKNVDPMSLENKEYKKIFMMQELQETGYAIKSFGSRDTLLATGWMISKYNLMQSLIDSRPLDRKREENSENDNYCTESEPIESIVDIHRALVKFSILSRHQLNLNLQISQNNHKISKLFDYLNFDSITASDAKAIKHESYLQQHVRREEQNNSRILRIINWISELSPIFWKWMESVVDEDTSTSFDLEPNAGNLVKEFTDLQCDLVDFESEVPNLECLLNSKMKKVSQNTYDKFTLKVQQEISEEHNDLIPNQSSDISFVYTTDTSKTLKLKETLENMMDEIDVLNFQVNCKRKYYKQLLNSKLDDIVVMEPIVTL